MNEWYRHVSKTDLQWLKEYCEYMKIKREEEFLSDFYKGFNQGMDMVIERINETMEGGV